MDIKETKELIEAIELLAVACAKISKGGLGLDDLTTFFEAAKEYKRVIEGFKSLDQVLPELKDIDQAEAIEIGSKMYNVVVKVKEAIK